MLYLDPHWLSRELSGLFEQAPDQHLPSFANTLQTESRLAHAVTFAFTALHQKNYASFVKALWMNYWRSSLIGCNGDA